jgi:hypothetical protein
MFFFAVTMGVNDDEGKKDRAADKEYNKHWIMSQYQS